MEQIEGIGLLIGADYYWRIVNDEQERIQEDLVAMSTKFGWVINGPIRSDRYSNDSDLSFALNVIGTAANEEEVFDLERFWNIESIGTNELQSNSDLNTEFVANFSQNCVELS